MKLLKADYQSPGKKGSRSFEDLDCYQMALDVMVNMHQIADALPGIEKYDLASQMRRASKSVSANLAEGYGRFHYLDTLRFYSIARGSLTESINHLITAKTLGYIEQDFFEQLYDLARNTERALNGLMNYVRKQRQGSQQYGDTVIKEKPEYYNFDEEPKLE